MAEWSNQAYNFREESLDDELRESGLYGENAIVGYVLAKAHQWERHMDSNYRDLWEEYNRIWRGKWDESDKTRQAERSRIVTPATQQAVESAVCDIEEATFGSGRSYDIHDDVRDDQKEDMEALKKMLDQELMKNNVRGAVNEVLINAAVYGTGIAEVVTEEVSETRMHSEEVLGGAMTAYGTYTENKVAVSLRPVIPRNFYIDPVATSVDTAHGVVLDEFVPVHSVLALQKNGTYLPGYVGTAAPDHELEPDPELPVVNEVEKVRITKYFGLVPRFMVTLANTADEDMEEYYDKLEAGEIDEDHSDLVEAIVVIANEGVLLKAEESPYMMKDRPVLAFQWDVVPGIFWGRGIVEKGYNSQKALDAEIRGRIDAMAYTVQPMLGMDATRIPRGHRPEVKAGKTILTNGSPKEVLMPFNFGSVDQITFAQAAELQNMLQQATGALDGNTLVNDMGSNNKTGAVSMALGSVVKRQKRTLVNFQNNFWLKYIEKAAWRYMQFDPDNFPVQDVNFTAISSLGIMAREYQVSQLVQLLQTTSDNSPLYPVIVTSIVDNMALDNREEMKRTLQEAAKIPPEEQKRIQEMHQMDLRLKKGQVSYVEAQAYESKSRGDSYKADAIAKPKEVEIKRIDAITKNLQPGAGEDTEFVRRLDIAKVALEERKLNIQEDDLRERREDNRRQLKAKEALDV